MQRPAIVVFTMATISVSLARNTEAVTAGDNAMAGAKLCAALRLGDDPVEFEPQVEKEPAAPTELYKLNMSLAPIEWRMRFAPKINGAAKEPAEKPKAPIPADWEKKWELWAQAEMALQTDDGETKLKKKLGLHTLSATAISLLRPEIATIADTAYELYKEYQESKGTPPVSDTELKTELLKAIYGAGTGYDNTGEGNKLYTGSAAAYATVCGNGATHDATLTVAATFACVCGVANSKASVGPCTKDTAINPQWEGGGIVTKANWPKLRSTCPPRTQIKLTSNGIENALATAVQSIAVKGTTAYIGTYGDGTCDGNAQGACVKVDNGAKDNVLIPEKIQWIAKLTAIADKLKQRTKYNNKAATATQQINQLQKLTESRVALGQLLPPAQQPSTHAPAIAAQTLQAKGQCEAIQTAKLCKEKEPKCEWKGRNDEDGPHCKFNTTAAEQQANQAEKDGASGAAPATSGCARHGSDKTACKNDKTGDKQNCAFRKGKENEPEPDKEMCRNGSFLATNNFALMVSAFVALLF
uniref:Variant surface glycoprotein 350 n=1 Tax=Trypanosoma brucei TaxID=5691 RepID=M4T1J9_9TRYP|nr:variant surface glycoprotein 350 [Trypanosoma brucei]